MKFWISPLKEEIEEDIFIKTGSRPARRPRRRPKNEQKQLDVYCLSWFMVGGAHTGCLPCGRSSGQEIVCAEVEHLARFLSRRSLCLSLSTKLSCSGSSRCLHPENFDIEGVRPGDRRCSRAGSRDA
ncbi:hypothetical protein EUGRSUZ_G02774 [Eucalyptus grandis]|uniref:Uncharacterized protein n=2 Tax=Eucalyptus grandis TaxID=71139 RepID=A0ACC3K7P3_EUCGR|nr:hypothetical protein EUGRSUZ_G02774 [Eucalyptus grandis]